MIVTVTPNPSVDLTYELAALVRGEVNRASVMHAEPSGKGVNVTRALRSNGHDSVAVLPQGGAEGVQLAALLDEEGVATVPVPVSGATRMNVTVAEPGGYATKINAPGPQLTASEVDALLHAAVEAARTARWVVISGSLPPGVPDDLVPRLCRDARATGARVALDSSGGALAAGLGAAPDVVKPNLAELREVTHAPVGSVGEVVAAARTLGGTVLVSAGARGALLVSPAGVWHAWGEVSRPVSTVGAGDALLAGFLAAGGSGPEALAEAVAWATAAVQLPGSRVPRVTDLHRSAVEIDPAPPADRWLVTP